MPQTYKIIYLYLHNFLPCVFGQFSATFLIILFSAQFSTLFSDHSFFCPFLSLLSRFNPCHPDGFFVLFSIWFSILSYFLFCQILCLFFDYSIFYHVFNLFSTLAYCPMFTLFSILLFAQFSTHSSSFLFLFLIVLVF